MTGSTVLLTATVRPNMRLYVAEDRADVRLSQYQEAIGAWIAQIGRGDELVVVETSGADAEELIWKVRKTDRGRIRVLSFDVSDSDPERGKGRLEADAILHAVDSIEQEQGSDRTIHKATGRLVLRNALRLVSPLQPHEIRIRMTADRSFADTRLLGASAIDWRQVVLADSSLVHETQGVFLEHTVAGAVARAAALKRVVVRPFPQRPVFVGRSGSTGRRYGPSVIDMAPWFAPFLEQRFAALAARKQV